MKTVNVKVLVKVMLATAALACGPLLAPSARAESPAATVRLADDTSGIAWHTQPDDIVAAMRQAAANHTPVLIVLHASWCPWCQRMDDETFCDPGVQGVMSRFVCIEVDTDTPFGQAMARYFGSTGVPTTVLFTADGNRLPLVAGYQNAADYTASLNQALGG